MVRIGLLGLGSIGRHASRLLLGHRSGFEIVGATTAQEADVGRRLDAVAGSDAPCPLEVSATLAEVLERQPDVVIDASRSFLAEVEHDVSACVDAGANVVSCCEQLAYPFMHDPDLAARLDASAARQGVTVLGTGVNPGFMFDSLLILATGVAWDIESIAGRRVVDVSGFSEDIHRRLGIGYTEDEFQEGHERGLIAGHVGFPESIAMVAEALGVALDGPVTEEFEPMVAGEPAPTTYGEVAAGRTDGFSQVAVGQVGGRRLLRLELLLHLRPESAGLEVGDSIDVDGEHPVRLRLQPGMDAMQATSAHLVNSIPSVLAASPGLKTAKDLPPAGAWLGDPEAVVFR